MTDYSVFNDLDGYITHTAGAVKTTAASAAARTVFASFYVTTCIVLLQPIYSITYQCQVDEL